ncbi:hypothetical protein TKK_0005590 [Trichogramma kaykai]
MGEVKEKKYGKLTIIELKKLLKERGARLSGRKAELVNRLIFYERNGNFGYEAVDKDNRTTTPDVKLYKDINASSSLPNFTKNHLDAFLSDYEATMEKGQHLYENGFLQYLRKYEIGNEYFVKGSVKAELKKHMSYICDVKLWSDGEVEVSSCDCFVGQSNFAHCKHVITVLIALLSWNINKCAILETTCTENLQTFHKPKRKYAGSPIKAQKFKKIVKCTKKNKYKNNLEIDDSENFKIFYQNYFQNVIKSQGFGNNMIMKQITMPANPYAVEWDHGFYTKKSNEYTVLKSLGLIDLTEEDVQQIELETMNQSDSLAWSKARSVRLTASIFHSCCMQLGHENAKNLVNRILSPVAVKCKAINHGKIYEEVAVKKFNEQYSNALDIKNCGLFIRTERPYLGATPDRLLFQESIIEVKCPYSIRFCEINAENLPYLQTNCDGELELKENHPYFYQIQGQLWATNRNFCDMIIYTFKDLKRISVKRNDIFINDMLIKLDEFYEKYLKPAIIEKYLFKSYSATF